MLCLSVTSSVFQCLLINHIVIVLDHGWFLVIGSHVGEEKRTVDAAGINSKTWTTLCLITFGRRNRVFCSWIAVLVVIMGQYAERNSQNHTRLCIGGLWWCWQHWWLNIRSDCRKQAASIVIRLGICVFNSWSFSAKADMQWRRAFSLLGHGWTGIGRRCSGWLAADCIACRISGDGNGSGCNNGHFYIV